MLRRDIDIPTIANYATVQKKTVPGNGNICVISISNMVAKNIRPSVILFKGNRILVVKSNYSSGEFYLLPGGSIEGAETTSETAIRETKEETNYDIKIVKLLYIQEWINIPRDKNVMYLIFLGTIVAGEETHMNDPGLEEGHISKIEWKTVAELEDAVFYPKGMLPDLKDDLQRGFRREAIMLPPDLQR
jgi:8-oxo-dGTP pyrophosphatase MutT (NUDIX family)